MIKKKFSEDLSRKIFFDLLKAIEACHKSGISHGDIKLENILFNSNFNLKLIDFGFAKNIKDGPISEVTSTRYYNAPEMFCCATKGYDGVTADIFSMGIILFILVMGFYPFDKPSITDSKYKLISKKDYNGFWKKFEQKLSNGNGVSHEFKDLFEKMVSYRPKERISINEIKKHPWLKELIKNFEHNQDEKVSYDKNNENIKKSKLFSPKKNKVKYLSHNSSFYKKDSNNFNYISNFSDGFNQVHINENNLLNIDYNAHGDDKQDDYYPKCSLNKGKEFEIKYLKELSSRKSKIDKILKEQEDEIYIIVCLI